jgi:hypothetical protein
MRSEAATLLDDASYTFRTTLPYPVAYRWREVEAAVSARSFKTAYEAILAAAEVLLCYAASTGLAVAREAGIELGAMKTIRDRLKPGAHGLSFGDWVTIIKEIEEGKAARRASDENPIADIRTFLTGADAHNALKRLSDRRNDESAVGSPSVGRGPSTPWYRGSEGTRREPRRGSSARGSRGSS